MLVFSSLNVDYFTFIVSGERYAAVWTAKHSEEALKAEPPEEWMQPEGTYFKLILIKRLQSCFCLVLDVPIITMITGSYMSNVLSTTAQSPGSDIRHRTRFRNTGSMVPIAWKVFKFE